MSTRLNKVNTVIAKGVAEIIRREIEIPQGTLVTVTRADTSVDLRYCTVYVSVLPAHRGPSSLAKLQRHLPHIQYVLNGKLVLRHRPKLRLALDPGEQHARQIEQVLAQEKRFGPRWHGRPKTSHDS